MNHYAVDPSVLRSEVLPDKDTSLTKSYVVWMMVILCLIHFTLNFLYLPQLKWFYLFELFCISYYTIRLPLKDSILPLVYLFFIEGQGRIIWEYNFFFRIVFDLVCILAILKSLAIHKKIMPKKLPIYFEIAIYLHLIWFCIQLFNVNSLGFFPVLATSKIYAFPFILFAMFLLNPIGGYSRELKILQIFFIGLIFFETLLSWYQMFAQEKGLQQISSYYLVAMKNEVFIGNLFRPFATTMVPGAIATYLAVTVGLFFLPSWQGTVRKLVTFSVLTLSGLTLFMSQIRSSMMKHVLILILSVIGFSFIGKIKTKILIPNIIIGAIFYFLIIHANLASNMIKDLDLTEASLRFSTVSEGLEITKHRIGVDEFIKQLAMKLYESPFGLGPGRTGAANSLNIDLIAQDPIYSRDASWTFDNLFIALAIDFGIGMIFYSFLVLGLPIYLLIKSIMMLIRKEKLKAQIIFTCAISGLVLVGGNWGANALPYNPESFMFWFWMAMGINHSYEGTKHGKINI